MKMNNIQISQQDVTSHLKPDTWQLVNRLHICKAISEFAHELLVTPLCQFEQDGWGYYTLSPSSLSHSNIEGYANGIVYQFKAKLLALDHWYLDKSSLVKLEDGKEVALDALAFIIEFSKTLGISDEVLPTYLEEISSTLYSSAYKHEKKWLSAAELAHASFQEVETSMTEGHPAFVANNGRIGFDAIDYRAYAPEAASPISLIWVAGHKSRAHYAAVDGLSYEKLILDELGAEQVGAFNAILKQLGIDSEEYLFLPVHPWQWYNKLATVYAHDIANRYMVLLGTTQDTYLAQQSIRTFFNTSHPQKYYVKTALSILNMGFMRGLSPYYMRTSPDINEWLDGLVKQDAYLQELGFTILKEVATVGYRNLYYEKAIAKDTPYKKMIAALWRESPFQFLKKGQKVMTMAALLHVDQAGNALLPELIKSSGIDTGTWLRKYFKAYLNPLIHCFFQYDLVFMPHGENLILVLENNVPQHVFMKDIAEEIGVLNTDVVLPEKVQRVIVSAPEPLKILYLFADVFDCIFRYISHILVAHSNYPEERFWEGVATCIIEYQEAHPHLEEKFERYDLFAPEFMRTCLNRIQLANNRQMIDLADPTKNLKFAGTQKNPVAAFKESLELRV